MGAITPVIYPLAQTRGIESCVEITHVVLDWYLNEAVEFCSNCLLKACFTENRQITVNLHNSPFPLKIINIINYKSIYLNNSNFIIKGDKIFTCHESRWLKVGIFFSISGYNRSMWIYIYIPPPPLFYWVWAPVLMFGKGRTGDSLLAKAAVLSCVATPFWSCKGRTCCARRKL